MKVWHVHDMMDISYMIICPSYGHILFLGHIINYQHDMSLTRFSVLPLSPWYHNWATNQLIFNRVTILLHILTIVALKLHLWINDTVFFTLLDSGHIISIGHIIVQLWVDELISIFIFQYFGTFPPIQPEGTY